MFINVTLTDELSDDFDKMHKQFANPLHEFLRGNKDYIDSNVVLTLDNNLVGDYSCSACFYTTMENPELFKGFLDKLAELSTVLFEEAKERKEKKENETNVEQSV